MTFQPPDPGLDPSLPAPCGHAVATLEIFDDLTGRTMVLYAPVSQPPDPALR